MYEVEVAGREEGEREVPRVLLLLALRVGLWFPLTHSLLVNLNKRVRFKVWEEKKTSSPNGELLKSRKI